MIVLARGGLSELSAEYVPVYCAVRAIAASAASWLAAFGPEEDASRDAGGGGACEWLVHPALSAQTVPRTAARIPTLDRQGDLLRVTAASPRTKSTGSG